MSRDKRGFAGHAPDAYARTVVTRDVDGLRERLRTVGLRATSARLAVLRCLVEANAPLSHAEVYDIVAGLGFDRATTYRNLVDLTEVGLARRTDHGDRTFRFELAGAEAGHDADAHAHFICNECGTVECLPDAAVAVTGARGVPKSVRKKNVEIQVRGVCDDCS
jgi:Fur family ferric uptake transcriptional regulator